MANFVKTSERVTQTVCQRLKVQYRNENLQKAIEAVRDVSNHLSRRQIAEKYGVPRSSLRYHIKNPGHKTSLGPSPILTVSEESSLDFRGLDNNFGKKRIFPKLDVLDTGQKFLVENPHPN